MSGRSLAMNCIAASRQIGHVLANVFVGIDTAAVGQAPFVSTISSAPRAVAISSNAGNHWAACESPYSTMRIAASATP